MIQERRLLEEQFLRNCHYRQIQLQLLANLFSSVNEQGYQALCVYKQCKKKPEVGTFINIETGILILFDYITSFRETS